MRGTRLGLPILVPEPSTQKQQARLGLLTWAEYRHHAQYFLSLRSQSPREPVRWLPTSPVCDLGNVTSSPRALVSSVKWLEFTPQEGCNKDGMRLLAQSHPGSETL